MFRPPSFLLLGFEAFLDLGFDVLIERGITLEQFLGGVPALGELGAVV